MWDLYGFQRQVDPRCGQRRNWAPEIPYRCEPDCCGSNHWLTRIHRMFSFKEIDRLHMTSSPLLVIGSIQSITFDTHTTHGHGFAEEFASFNHATPVLQTVVWALFWHSERGGFWGMNQHLVASLFHEDRSQGSKCSEFVPKLHGLLPCTAIVQKKIGHL